MSWNLEHPPAHSHVFLCNEVLQSEKHGRLVETSMGQVLDTGAEIGVGFQKSGAELQSFGQTVNTLGRHGRIQGEKETKRKRILHVAGERQEKVACTTFIPEATYLHKYIATILKIGNY